MRSVLKVELEQEFRRCAADEHYFLNKYWKIRVPGKGRITMRMYPDQEDTLRIWQQNRKVIALKARQIGFTTLAAGHSFHKAFFHSDQSIIMLSKGEREAREILGKASYGYRHLPSWMKRRGPKATAENLEKLSFANDSIIKSLPSKEDPARGESVDLVIVDEWASLDNPEEAWASIEPITDVGGSVIGFSTAKGSGNFFHHTYLAARQGKNSFVALFYPWSAASWRDEQWYEQKTYDLQHTEWVLHQEYPRNDDEAFIKSGATVFDYDVLRKLAVREPEMRGYLKPDPYLPEGRASGFVSASNGQLKVWETPQKGVAYVIGADVAEGLEHGDYSAAHVINVRTGDVVAIWHGKIDHDLFGSDTLWHLGWWYNCALVGIEVNNHGHSTIVQLRNRLYPNIYHRMVRDKASDTRTKRLGWRTQSNTKPILVDELWKAVRDSEVHIYDDATVKEMTTFVRDERGHMSGSPFDDLVISFGIAVQMIPHAFDDAMVERPSDYMTWGWFMREVDREEVTGEADFRVGSHNVRAA